MSSNCLKKMGPASVRSYDIQQSRVWRHHCQLPLKCWTKNFRGNLLATHEPALGPPNSCLYEALGQLGQDEPAS